MIAFKVTIWQSGEKPPGKIKYTLRKWLSTIEEQLSSAFRVQKTLGSFSNADLNFRILLFAKVNKYLHNSKY